MNFMNKSLFFVFALLLHVELIFIFSFNFYVLYFINLFIVMYILHRKFNDFSLLLFSIYTVVILFIVNLNIYDELLFELCIFLNILDKAPFINSEVMYALSIVHVLLLLNLKRFEIFWAIIDKKIFRN